MKNQNRDKNDRTIKLTIEYDGSGYCGWQRQKNGLSVQEVMERAVRSMTDEDNPVIGAGRTDAGVHALGQVAHFSTRTNIPQDGFVRGLNSILPKDIRIIEAQDMPSDFHARKSAKMKIYRYMIYTETIGSALMYDRAWHVPGRLNVQAMKRAALKLKGKHDFAAFQASGSSVNHSVRTIHDIGVRRSGVPIFWGGCSLRCHREEAIRPEPVLSERSESKDGDLDFSTTRSEIATLPAKNFWQGARNDKAAKSLITIEIAGDGFLRHMVRNIVGTLVEVGQGKIPESGVEEILKGADRGEAGVCAPASGLYLVRVFY